MSDLYEIVRCLICFALGACCSQGSEVKHVKLNPTSEMRRAELFVWLPEKPAKSVIVFCPGHNGVGKSFVGSLQWQAFAKKRDMALCGLSFASDYNLTRQGKGYSHVERGSGKLLLDALDGIFKGQNIPLFLYGYSAGARFTASFVAWKPDRLLGWCASGVGRWPALPVKQKKGIPHGIVACGEYDAACYWSSLNYFQRARKQGRKWTWLSLKNLGHGYSKTLDGYVRASIEHLCSRTSSERKGVWFDLDTKKTLSGNQSKDYPEFSVWVPKDDNLIGLWNTCHHP